ncbi:MAG: formate dehydrogenase [Paracoccaceae bacterium]|nr:MAG: formate dehydrogenase [Paracoccaceae bacterium]
MGQPRADSAPRISDEIRRTTCYMCACRCGIDVHLRHGPAGSRVVHIEGNRAHPVNRGVLCAKGSAGIMQHLSPARLRAPLRRTGPRGSGQFEEIGWEEALRTAVDWLGAIRRTDPRRLAFFTGRDQSQALTGWWAQQFGTPNYAAHGGFCSVNMAAAGIMTLGGAFWEFGAPDWARTRYLMLFGVAEDHDSNPIKIGLGQLKARGARVVSVNPVRTGYSAIADEWLGITPGSDGLFILALAHELMRRGAVDIPFLVQRTDAPFLVVTDPGAPDHGLFLRDGQGRRLFAARDGGIRPEGDPAVPALAGSFRVGDRPCRPVFALLADHLLDPAHAPEAVAPRCGIPAGTIRRIAAEIAHVAFREAVVLDRPWTDVEGRHHARMIGRPVSFHAMRGISAHANGFQTCRALHMLQILLGAVDCPGAFRFKPPCPKPMEAHPRPHAASAANRPLDGPHLGFPRGPEDLCVAADGTPLRIDKAFSWEAPFAAHGMMHMVIPNAAAGDPYRIDTLFLYMANMAWNSSMNTAATLRALTATGADGEYLIPRIICADAYASEMVAHADLVLPDTTYLERHDCISLLDRPISEPDAAADAIRWPVVTPDRQVRGFQSVLIELGARLGLPGFVDDSGAPAYRDYADYIVRHERRPGIGPLIGYRGDGSATGRGAPNPDQLDRYIAAGGFFRAEIPEEAAFFRPWNRAWQEWAVAMGFQDAPQPFRLNLWLEPLARFQRAAEGHGPRQPPDHLRARILRTFSPLPIWYPASAAGEEAEDYPLHAITQRPMAMYHSWGSQNAWLRQIHGENPLYLPGPVCDAHGLSDGDWVWVISAHGRIRVPVRRMEAVNPATLWTWNAIGKREGAWALAHGAPEARRGFLLNHLIGDLLPARDGGPPIANADPITGQAAWYDLRVRIEKALPGGRSEPVLPPLASPVPPAPAALGRREDLQ